MSFIAGLTPVVFELVFLCTQKNAEAFGGDFSYCSGSKKLRNKNKAYKYT